MSVVIHDGALVAVDALQRWEREELMSAVDAFSIAMEGGGPLPPGTLERDGVVWLPVSLDLRAVLRPVQGSPGRFILLDVVRPETLRNLFPNAMGRSIADGGVA